MTKRLFWSFFFVVFLSVQVLSVPQGFTTYFSGRCPSGWTPANGTEGRLILSVMNSSAVGIKVNDPLSDREDRSHNHPYQTSINIPNNPIAADECCNNQGGRAGSYPISSSLGDSSSGLPFVQFSLCTLTSQNKDPIAYGTIAFFDPSIKQCPSNWSPYGQADGRFIIAGFTNTSITSTTDPLSSGEDRQHTHSFTVAISTNNVDYAGVSGCCNDNVGSNGRWGSDVVSDSSSTGLPYIQLLTCQSQELSFNTSLPFGAFMLREGPCTPGWTQSFDSAGRFIVALPAGGSPGATFGSASFPPDYRGNPEHSHGFSGSIDMGGTGVGLASGCCASGYAGAGGYSFQGDTDSSPVDLPFLSLVLCEQTSAQKLIS